MWNELEKAGPLGWGIVVVAALLGYVLVGKIYDYFRKNSVMDDKRSEADPRETVDPEWMDKDGRR